MTGAWSAAQADITFPSDISENIGEDIAPQVSIPIRVSIKSDARISDARVYLGDVATCEGLKDMCAEVASIDIGQSPPPGRRQTILKQQIESILAQEISGASLSVEGEERVLIESAFETLDVGVIEQYLRDAIAAILADQKRFRLSNVKIQQQTAIKVRPGEFSLYFPDLQRAHAQHVDWLFQHMTGSKSFRMVYESEGHRTLNRKIGATIDIEQIVPVTKKHLSRGTILKHEFFEHRWLPFNFRTKSVVPEIAGLVGMRLKRQLRSGQPVVRNHVTVPIAVKRGQIVKLSIQKNSLRIAGEAKAMQSGGVGETIQIYYKPTRKKMNARVVSPLNVEVVL